MGTPGTLRRGSHARGLAGPAGAVARSPGTATDGLARAVAAYGLLHFAVALLGPLLAVPPEGFPIAFPTGGLLLGVLCRVERRRWTPYALVALVAELAASWLLPPAAVAGAFARGLLVAAPVHVLEALLGAYLATNFVGHPLRLSRVGSVLALVGLGCVLVPAACSPLGAALLLWDDAGLSLRAAWSAWWYADATGAVVVAPLVLAVRAGGERGPRVLDEDGPGGLAELVAAWAAALAIALLAASDARSSFAHVLGSPHALVLVLVWIALRFPPLAFLGPAAACALVMGVATASGAGVFAAGEVSADALASPPGVPALQGLVVLATGTALLVGASVRERVRATRQLQQAETRLEAVLRLEESNRHVAGVAHDFRNVNMALGGNVELLRVKGVPPDSERFLASLEKAVDAAQVLVDRMVNPPGSTERLTDCDLPALAAEVTERLRGSLPGGVQLDCALASESVHAYLDPLAFDRVLTNLVRNAAEAVEEEGHVTVSVLREGAQAVLVVADDGRGMDEATRRRIFDPFFTTKGKRGTGIGLWSVRQLVEESGGTIAVRSRLGEGATFTVRWPLRSPQPS